MNRRVKCPHELNLLNMQVLVLDWLHLGRPMAAPPELRLGMKLNSKQWSAVQMLRFLSWDGNSVHEVDARAMGRAASKVESFDDEMVRLHDMVHSVIGDGSSYFGHANKACDSEDRSQTTLRSGFLVGRCKGKSNVAAKPIQADRLVFQSVPKFDPRPYMDKLTAAWYDDPMKMATSQVDGSAMPTVRMHGDVEQVVALYKKLADTGRLRPVLGCEIRAGVVAGAFSVVKDLERDRLILDSRPANLYEEGPKRWVQTMANASTLCDMVLQPSEILTASGEDLRDFFYQFRTSHRRTCRNVLAQPLSMAQAREVFGDGFKWLESPVWCGLATLAMGDTNSCEFAQCSHVQLCLVEGVCSTDELLTLRGFIPRSPTTVGIIIDDLVILERMLRSHFETHGGRGTASDEKLECALAAYAKAGLDVNLKKEFKHERCSRFWGIELDGDKGLVRASTLRMWPVIFVTMRVALMGSCTVGLLEALSGSWIALLAMRRRLMCCMDLIFEALSIKDQRQVIRLSDKLKDELWVLSVLGPLACTNLRAQYLGKIVATDSSLEMMAGVHGEVPVPIAAEVGRRSLKRGVWSRLLPPGQAWLRAHGQLAPEDELPEDCYQVHPLWSLLARSVEYVEDWRQPIRRKRHINVAELQAHLIAERRECANHRHCRILYALDSQVSIGALVKGRAAASLLNKQLQQSLGTVLGSDNYGLYLYYPSAFNRADQPTRGAKPSPPDLALPRWWEDAAVGNFASLDEWLEQVEAGVITGENMLQGVEPQDLSASGQDASGLEWEPQKAGVTMARVRRASRIKVAVEYKHEIGAYLSGLLESLDPSMFFGVGPSKGQFELTIDSAGGLDLYSGRCGVARCMVQLGAPWVLTVDIEHGAGENLLDVGLQQKILQLIRGHAFATVGAAPICSSFSRAITPPCRTKQRPRGIPGVSSAMASKIREGNLHGDFVLEVIGESEEHLVGFWAENPDSSWLWEQRGYEKYRCSKSEHVFRCSFCRFGRKWRKNTKFATNLPLLKGLRMMCAGGHRHQVLRGRSKKHRKCWTLVAQPYPHGLCKIIARACCSWGGWKLNGKCSFSSSCARCSDGRIGEAANPGPKRSRGNRHIDLEGVALRTAATEALEARLLNKFFCWCMTECGESVQEHFRRCPELLGAILKAYGLLEFQSGGALSNFRHLVLAVQRWLPSFRMHSTPCWDLVMKWEVSEPVEHRPPLPEGLMRAMVCLAWHLGWYRWCGVTVLAFYGAGRIGEVLRCTRADILFPADVLEESGGAVFLQLKQFKSLGRQPSRIQHMKIVNKDACRILERVYEQLELFEALFCGSAGMYRKRWDSVLWRLKVPPQTHLTPGCLRSGAAVAAYRAGRPISDILWMRRLRSQQTLESYLQEVAAMATLQQLPEHVRDELRTIALLFPFLCMTAVRDQFGKSSCG
eukprot:Skav201238  [mRNA]  locus=scaffold3524:39770:44044:- [translate_table: standard]